MPKLNLDRRRKLKALLASLILHGLLVLCVLFFPKAFVGNRRLPSRDLPLEIFYQPPPSPPTSSVAIEKPLPELKPSGRQTQVNKKVKAPTPALSQLTSITGSTEIPAPLSSRTVEHGDLDYAKPYSLDESNQFAPFLLELHRRIDSQLDFRWDLIDPSGGENIEFLLILHSDGRLIRVESKRRTDSHLSMWIRSQLPNLLKEAIQTGQKIPEEFAVTASFDLQTFSHEPLPSPPIDQITGRSLNFYRYRVVPSILQAVGSASDEREKALDVDLLSIFEYLFASKPSDPSRIQWDLKMRLRESSSACDAMAAEGACVIAGKIEEAFGNKVSAAKYFTHGCDLKYDPACKELQRLTQTPQSSQSQLQR
jgi:hypothetical protein